MDSPSRKPGPNRDNDLNGSSLVGAAAKRVTGLGTNSGTKIRSMTSAISKTEDNVAMSSQSRTSQSHLRKFNYVGLIALVLLMGSMVGSAFAAVTDITVSTNRLAVTAGQATEDDITLTLSGAAGDLQAAGTIKITPPTGWTAVQDGVPANAGYVSVDTGTLNVVGTKAQISALAGATTSVTVDRA